MTLNAPDGSVFEASGDLLASEVAGYYVGSLLVAGGLVLGVAYGARLALSKVFGKKS